MRKDGEEAEDNGNSRPYNGIHHVQQQAVDTNDNITVRRTPQSFEGNRHSSDGGQ